MNIIELLSQFNLTSNEATIYHTLLQQGSLNGYQIAKVSGISRSNTYTSLASLVEKGCAYKIEGDSTRYCPLSVDEFCSNRIRAMEITKQELIKQVPKKSEGQQGYITIKGFSHISDKIKNMMDETQDRIYLSMPHNKLDLFKRQIVSLASRDIKVVLITDTPTTLKNIVTYLSAVPIKQVRIISDSSKVLTGDFNEGNHSTCLYSEKKNLVDLIKDSIKNEMTLIEMQSYK